MLKVDLDVQTDRAGDDGAADAIDTSETLVVGVDNVGTVARDGRALATGVIADLHTLDCKTSELGLDSRDIPAGPAVVACVAKVKFTPGASVAAEVVGGEIVTLCGTPGALGVLIKGNVLGLTGVDREPEGGVAVPAGQLTIRAHLVPEDDGPRVIVGAVDTDDVLVLRGLVARDFDDVAAPGIANVTLVVDSTTATARGFLAEAFASELTVLRDGEPAVAGTGVITGDGGGSSSDSSDGHIGGVGGSGSGSGRSGSRGVSSVGLAGPLIDKGDEFAVDGGIDHITDTTLVDFLSASMVVVTAFMTMKTGNSRASGQSGKQKEGILELHFERNRNRSKDKGSGLVISRDTSNEWCDVVCCG